ncbi:MAG: hypothetical protein IJV40_06080 [Oscillospiraceae bacterium]|nr:hypothetical protein [Oscillospiraceae bacterium]
MTENKNAAPVYRTGSGTERTGRLSSETTLPQNLPFGKNKPADPGGESTTLRQLKDMPIWICWRRKPGRNGHITKVPVSPRGGATGTDDSHRSTWTNHSAAAAAAKKNRWDGVGFVIPEGFAFLDLDGLPPEDPLTRDLMALLPSYAERSVSGTGTHIYMRCDLSRLPTVTDEKGRRRLSDRYYMKNPRIPIELYIGGLTNRYAVFTGNTSADLPPDDCTDGLLTVLDSYMLREDEPANQKPSERTASMSPVPAASYSAGESSDTEELALEALDIVQALRRQGNAEKFSRLYDQGDLSDYLSRSEADLALCSIIAFRTGNRPDLIDAVFRGSALYRDKWEREDYRRETIRRAVEFQRGIFHPDTDQLPSFLVFQGKKPGLSAPLLAAYIREHVPYVLVRDNNRQTGMIYVYEDGVYRLKSRDSMLGIIKEPVERYNPIYANMSKINEVYQHLLTDREAVSLDALNADETCINFRNGLLSVTGDKLELKPHSPAVLSTIQIPCDWTGKETPTPVFDGFLRTLSNEDPAVAELLLQFSGVSISNVKGYRMKKSLFHVGPGDTGKSQLKSLVEHLLGPENYMAIDLNQLEARFGTGTIFGKRMAGSSDISYLKVNEMNILKNLTGGDSVLAEYKNQQAFLFTYNGVLWFCMNHLPKFGGDDGKWVYERIIIVESRNVIPKELQDKQLLDKMLREREGIIFQMVKALQTVIRNGYRYTEPESVIAARNAYIAENSSHVGFFEECMCPRKDHDYSDGCTVTAIYDAYRNWCRAKRNGYCKTQDEFRNSLADHVGAAYSQLTVHREDANYFRDYTLKPEAIDEYLGIFGPQWKPASGQKR